MPQEPNTSAFSNQISRYFFATRPPFLLATVAACALGLVGAWRSGMQINTFTAALTVLLAVLLHAAINVINDYCDALNGTDAVNTGRIYPFTGGSRFIQNGVLTINQTRHFGYFLLGIVTIVGLALATYAGLGLIFLGLIGMLVGWAYSALPLQLNARGLGECCVCLGFLGVVIGADFVQRHAFSIQPIIVGLSYALLVTNLLYINQFPDREADSIAQKHNLVVRLPVEFAPWGYALIATLACAWIICMVLAAVLPWQVLLALFPLVLSSRAFFLLKRNARQPSSLLAAIQFTLASMLSHAVLLTLILIWTPP